MTTIVARRDSAAPSLVEGEFAFQADDFRRIAALLYQQAGIILSEGKATLVYSRLAKRIRTLRLGSFAEYCDLLDVDQSGEERSIMLNALTTNLTRFFREPHHFEHLRDTVLLPRASQLRAGGRLRLWSAGCSSGQEPYSLALTILSALPDAADLDVKILATDIDSNMIAQARLGVYLDEQVEPITSAQRDRWLERSPDQPGAWRVGEVARSLVTFNHLNLMNPWPMKGCFQAIFCRNVVIYFDEPTQVNIWNRMAPLLASDGRLYIGHSERVGAAANQFVSDGLTVYRTPEGRA